jgi:hypothetical protein
VDGTAVAGEWIELTFPTTTVVNRINITSSSTVAATQSPRDFVVAAYVDGLWISVLQESSVQGWTDNETRSFTFSATGAATKYRFITQGVLNASRVSIGELSFDTPPPYAIQVLEQRLADTAQVTGARVPPAPLQSALLEFGGVSYTASASVGTAYNAFDGSSATDWHAIA